VIPRPAVPNISNDDPKSHPAVVGRDAADLEVGVPKEALGCWRNIVARPFTGRDHDK